MSPTIFLSHAHADASDAQRFAEELRERLAAAEGVDVEIFRTSDPQYRFEPSAAPSIGADLREWSRRYAEELRAYLDEQLRDCAAYLLLVTERSARRSRPWIRWEMHEASAMAQERGLVFIPCLLGVDWNALWAMAGDTGAGEDEDAWTVGVPVGKANPAEYQGIRLDEADGLARLARALAPSLERR